MIDRGLVDRATTATADVAAPAAEDAEACLAAVAVADAVDEVLADVANAVRASANGIFATAVVIAVHTAAVAVLGVSAAGDVRIDAASVPVGPADNSAVGRNGARC